MATGDDEDREAILARRRFFVVTALAGVTVAEGCRNPFQPCLEVAAPPDTAPPQPCLSQPPRPCLQTAPPEARGDAGLAVARDAEAVPAPCLQVPAAPPEGPPRHPEPHPRPCLRPINRHLDPPPDPYKPGDPDDDE